MAVVCKRIFASSCICLSLVYLPPAQAAEGGSGFYLLGTRGQMAGMSLPPGLYAQNDIYLYSGKSRTNVDVPLAGSAYLGVDAHAYVDLPTLIWVPDKKIGNASLTLNATLPVGYKKVSAFAALPGIGFGADTSDHTTRIGDPTIGASLGWNHDKWHWNVAGLVNVPIGDYRRNQLANLSYNY